MEKRITETQSSYDEVAQEYVQRIFNELEHKPFDRALLNRFAAAVKDSGLACDMGCGPGQVARYLHECGINVCGIDLSEGMIEQARRLNPDIEFKQGDMMGLDVEAETFAGIAAFYSIIHIPREQVPGALRELKRVLQPEGLLLLAFHAGDEVIHLEEWWGKRVCVDFTFFRAEEMEGFLKSAGFAIEETMERPPYEGIEHPSQRVYILARKTA
jgi:ubiquinone/menaquinone biosynthesis C-methylase UbiE